MSNYGVKRGLSFLFPNRLANLSGIPTYETAVSEVKVPFLSETSQIGAERHRKAEPLTKQDRLELLDFLIANAGYFDESKIDALQFAEIFRKPLEEIIQEQQGIFEDFFLEVKKHVSILEEIDREKKAQGKENEMLGPVKIAAQARITALKTLKDRFKSLGAYYDSNSKYYFDENELSTALSRHFLTALYGQPQLAQQMLNNQAEKTVGQLEGKKEDLEKLIPSSYYQDVETLRKIKNYFDLFLIEPRILDLANETPTSINKLPARKVVKADAERMKVETPDLSQLEYELNDFLLQNRESFGTDLSDKTHLNVIEKLFYTFYVLMPQLEVTQLPPLQARKEALVAAEKARKAEVDTAYLAKHHEGKKLSDLKGQIPAIREKMIVEEDKDARILQIRSGIEDTNQSILNLQQKISAFKVQLQALRALALSQYRGIEKTVLDFNRHFEKLEAQFDEMQKFEKDGGNFSCLSFLPVRIYNPYTQQYNYECLVALSGMEIDTGNNPHKLLSEFAKHISAKIDDKTFRFRYVDPSAQNLDLILEQLGKGLSGKPAPLRVDTYRDILPDFTKQCAEKRLITELMKLIQRHGSNVQVLGCDNLALPCAKHAQKALETVERAKEKAALEVKKPQSKEKAKAPKAPKEKGKAAEAKAESAQPKEHAPHQLHVQLPGKDAIELDAVHIPCCKSCQAQKPAVFTFLYHTLQRTERLNREQAALLPGAVAFPVENPAPQSCKAESGVVLESESKKGQKVSL